MYEYDNNLPGIVDIIELAEEPDEEILDDYNLDPNFEPNTSARSRGNVVRKRNNNKDKKPRSRSRGRRTRSQAAQDNEIKVD